jgi:hypothetical protein
LNRSFEIADFLLSPHGMTPHEFIKKWKPVALTERATAQTHFIDLCSLLGHPDPIAADPTGQSFTFEKGVPKTGGGEGFADVWKKGFFAWEYKKKKRNLDDALVQLVRYAAALENPPLQVACDTDRFLVRPAWTNAVPKAYEFSLDELAEPKNLELLHNVFFDPENYGLLRPAPPSQKKPLISFLRSHCVCKDAVRLKRSRTLSINWCFASLQTV